MITKDQTFTQNIRFSQEQVIAFAHVTGDTNPLHLDPEFAAKTIFRRPVVHGMLMAGLVSKALGMDFPGEGTIYLKQELHFEKPLYVDSDYVLTLTVLEADPRKHTASISTQAVEKESGKVVLSGVAQVYNKQAI